MRPMIQFVQKRFGPKKLIGAEIGVQRGNHALAMINNLQFKQLVLIDIWRSIVTKPSAAKKSNEGLLPNMATAIDKANDIFYPLVIKRFGKKKNVTILRKYSVEASKDFPNKYFDFIYIDACHRYDAVVQDIKNWLPKVKKGGIFGGHDYGYGYCPGVIRAVNEFIRKTNFKLNTECADWWIEL